MSDSALWIWNENVFGNIIACPPYGSRFSAANSRLLPICAQDWPWSSLGDVWFSRLLPRRHDAIRPLTPSKAVDTNSRGYDTETRKGKLCLRPGAVPVVAASQPSWAVNGKMPFAAQPVVDDS